MCNCCCCCHIDREKEEGENWRQIQWYFPLPMGLLCPMSGGDREEKQRSRGRSSRTKWTTDEGAASTTASTLDEVEKSSPLRRLLPCLGGNWLWHPAPQIVIDYCQHIIIHFGCLSQFKATRTICHPSPPFNHQHREQTHSQEERRRTQTTRTLGDNGRDQQEEWKSVSHYYYRIIGTERPLRISGGREGEGISSRNGCCVSIPPHHRQLPRYLAVYGTWYNDEAFLPSTITITLEMVWLILIVELIPGQGSIRMRN